jgi:hypothetical protein
MKRIYILLKAIRDSLEVNMLKNLITYFKRG